MANWSDAVSCAEEADTQQESYDEATGLMSASVTLRCAYSSRHALVADICGSRKSWLKGAAGVVPKAASASIKPVLSPDQTMAVDGQLLVYLEALVTINFNTKITELASESIEPTAEFLTLDHKWFRWGPIPGSGFPDYNVLREEEAPGRLMRGINYVRNDIDVTGPLSSSLTDLVGYCNADTVSWSLLGFTSPPETLLYSPPAINYKYDSTGNIKFNVTKKFTYKPEGWNVYYRAATGNFQPIYIAGTVTPYKSYPPSVFGGVLL